MAHSTHQGARGTHSGEGNSAGRKAGGHYGRLAVMALLSFVSMYILMYAMVDRIGNVSMNLNQVYMAGLMAAPMVVLELILMGAMYRDRKRNLMALAASGLAFVVFFGLIRAQAGISDREFLRSMIPHHGAALLMCERAPIEDPDILDLCRRIVAGQQAEIDEMNAKLEELGG